MTFVFNKSTPATSPIAMYNLISCLESAGWIQMEAGDGTNYFAPGSGTYITSGLATTNGMGNNYSWTRIQDPSGTREFTIQRITTVLYRIKYSLGAKFISVAGDNNSTPAATDEVVLLGSGTDASPGGTGFFGTDFTYRFNVCADDAPPYGFWAGGFYIRAASDAVAGFLCLDPLDAIDPTDAHPYIIYVRGLSDLNGGSTGSICSQSGSYNYSTYPSATPTQWLQYGGAMYYTATGQVIPLYCSTSPITKKYQVFPILFVRTAYASGYDGSFPGYKGVSTLLKWGVTRRSIGSTLSISNVRDRIVYGDVSLPWDGTIPDV